MLIIMKLKCVLRNFFKNLIFKIKISVVYILSLMNMPRAAALFIYLITKNIIIQKNNKKCLVFISSGGIQDLDEISNNGLLINLYLLDHIFLQIIVKAFFKKEFNDYTFNEAYKLKEYIKYSEFIFRFIYFLTNQLKISMFINFNFVYYAHREFIKVAHEIKVPFVTLMKECHKTSAMWEIYKKSYNDNIGPIKLSTILVHNETSQKMIQDSVIGKNNIIKVVGQARSDSLFRKNTSYIRKGNKIHILYFQISPTAGLPYLAGIPRFDLLSNTDDTNLIFNWKNLNNATTKALVNFINKNLDYVLTIKSKPNYHLFDDISSELKYDKNRVKIISGPPDMNLYNEADLVIGFNTTALIEAIASGVPAISSEISLPDIKNIDKFTFDYNGCIYRARSELDMINYIRKLFCQNSIKNDDKVSSDLLYKYLGNNDGAAGLRSAAEINSIINMQIKEV